MAWLKFSRSSFWQAFCSAIHPRLGKLVRFLYSKLTTRELRLGKAEASAIVKERARIVEANRDSTFAKVGLLSDESVEWLTAR
jgi:hypothetical protein